MFRGTLWLLAATVSPFAFAFGIGMTVEASPGTDTYVPLFLGLFLGIGVGVFCALLGLRDLLGAYRKKYGPTYTPPTDPPHTS